MSPELAVVIVSWNTRELTLDALRTLYDDLNAHGPETRVWVVDNASADGSPDAIRDQFPQTTLVASEENLGFAGGNNRALRMMGFSDSPAPNPHADAPRAIYLLNSDTRTQPGATRALYDALFSLPCAGLVGAQLAYADGSFQHGAFHFPGLRQLLVDLFPVPSRLHESTFNGRYPRDWFDAGAPFPVDHTLGATMMLRRETIEQTGLFDEAYFMYCEEIDWSMRIRRAGWEIYTVPEARVTHLAGQSTQQVRAASIVSLWRSRWLFFERYYSPPKRLLARLIIRWGMQRQIALTHHAHMSGEIDTAQCDTLIDAYQTIQQLMF